MEATHSLGPANITIENAFARAGGIGRGGPGMPGLLDCPRTRISRKSSGAERLALPRQWLGLAACSIGGTALGLGRGEEVYPLPALPPRLRGGDSAESGSRPPKAFDGLGWEDGGGTAERG